MEKLIVYKVTFPNDKIYIGISSKGLEVRKKSHYRRMESGEGWKFYNALRKYQGKEGSGDNIAISLGGKTFKVFKKGTKKFVGEWTSQRKCAADLNIYFQSISKCLRNISGFQSCKGYIFEYSDKGE